jgi:SAM-dependent methyltransferase
VLVEPTPAMAALCREFDAAEVWTCEAEALPADAGPFDVVLCLWNVLGHVDGHARRVEALRRMGASLASGGRLVADVHNRYNAATAGRMAVARRLWRDWRAPAEGNGDVEFTWQVEGQSLPARGHLFSPAEVRALCADAGLSVERVAYVDYVTGRTAGAWTGQLAFMATRR